MTDSLISLLCNPINSSPYFPSSPSGSLAGFVYWRRGWEEGELTGSERLYNLPLCVEEEREKISRKLNFTYFSLIQIHALLWEQSAVQRIKTWEHFFFISKQKRRAVCSAAKPQRSLTVSLSESGRLTKISALTEEEVSLWS